MQTLVLKTVGFKESDLIVTFLTEEVGKFSAYALGARNSKKRFPGGIEPFDVAEISIKERSSGMPSLTEFTKHNLFPELRTSLEKFRKGAAVLELCNILAPENDSSTGPLLQLAIDSLRKISTSTKEEAEWVSFAKQAILISGFEEQSRLEEQMKTSSISRIIEDITHQKLRAL